MKLTILRAIPLVLALDVALFLISGVGSLKDAKHGTDYWIGEVDWLAFLVGVFALVVLATVALYRRTARRRVATART